MHLKSDKELKTKLQVAEFELLVPANNKQIAMQAIKAGADAIYIGYAKYGARIQAGNTMEDLVELIEFAHTYRVKVYITLNTILKNEEIKNIEKLIWHLYIIKADGIIIQDMGILECNLPPIPIIASTQCHNNTLEKVKFLEKTGFKRVIFPREITIDEIKEINKNTNIELETFVHGALCMSYSGQCYLSYAIGGRSANRGECAQPCRKKYSLKDSSGKFILRDKHILSLKDLNLSDRLEDLILSGVATFFGKTELEPALSFIGGEEEEYKIRNVKIKNVTLPGRTLAPYQDFIFDSVKNVSIENISVPCKKVDSH